MGFGVSQCALLVLYYFVERMGTWEAIETLVLSWTVTSQSSWLVLIGTDQDGNVLTLRMTWHPKNFYFI